MRLSTPVSNALTNRCRKERCRYFKLFAASFRAEDKNALVALRGNRPVRF
jgi:hypothetical protein